MENSSIPNLNLNVTSNDYFLVNVFRSCVLCFNVLFGSPVHAYVLWLIVTGRGIASEFLYIQVSVSEIIICVKSLLMFLALMFTESVSVSFAMGFTITSRYHNFQCLICVEGFWWSRRSQGGADRSIWRKVIQGRWWSHRIPLHRRC